MNDEFNSSFLTHLSSFLKVGRKTKTVERPYRLEELLSALSGFQYPIAFLTLNGIIKWVNSAFEYFYGDKGEILEGKPITSLYSKESQEVLPPLQEIIIKDNWRGDLTFLKKDKTVVPVYVTFRVVPDDKGAPFSLITTIEELTSRKAIEKQLIQSEKLAVIGTLAAGIAHELNQPLMVIRGYTQILLSNYPQDPELKDTLKRIESQTTRMIKIIQHLRNFSRGSMGVKEPLAVNPIIENAFTLFTEQLRAHGIQVTKELAEDLPQIKGDVNQLEQVIINLIANARDAIDAKGSGGIKVTSHLKKPDEIEVLFSDTGTGMPADVAGHVFEPFFTTKETGKGTGLGLTISYGIIKDHGGTISVDSKEGKGTMFTITLPVHKA